MDNVLCASAACVAPLEELYRAPTRQPGSEKPALNNDYGREYPRFRAALESLHVPDGCHGYVTRLYIRMFVSPLPT